MTIVTPMLVSAVTTREVKPIDRFWQREKNKIKIGSYSLEFIVSLETIYKQDKLPMHLIPDGWNVTA